MLFQLIKENSSPFCQQCRTKEKNNLIEFIPHSHQLSPRKEISQRKVGEPKWIKSRWKASANGVAENAGLEGWGGREGTLISTMSYEYLSDREWVEIGGWVSKNNLVRIQFRKNFVLGVEKGNQMSESYRFLNGLCRALIGRVEINFAEIYLRFSKQNLVNALLMKCSNHQPAKRTIKQMFTNSSWTPFQAKISQEVASS